MFLVPIQNMEDVHQFNKCVIVSMLELEYPLFELASADNDPNLFYWLVYDSVNRDSLIGAVQFSFVGDKKTNKILLLLSGVFCIPKYRGDGFFRFIVDELLHEFNSDILILEPSKALADLYAKRGTSLPRCSILC